MGITAQSIVLDYSAASAVMSFDDKENFLSVRLIRDSDEPLPDVSSFESNILLNGKCVDAENRKLYLFFVDTFYEAAWIIEVGIDTRVQTVVYYDPQNAIGFSPSHKIHNPRVVFGKIIWTDGYNPVYQLDIARAKKSFYYRIGYAPNENVAEWADDIYYYSGQICSRDRYFYRCTLANNNHDPLYQSDYWERLCLIEEAYYSMNVENFYFAPMPPKLPPVVSYYSDAERNLNNLRQTLFQFAYNYVYMDWRESTFSPACIVPIPTAEEEIATGLATEMISRNNCLKISVNSGGEEVRKIRIIGRSSRNPSTWFVVEEIDKLASGSEETGGTSEESSGGTTLEQSGNITLTITIKTPILRLSGITVATPVELELSFPAPTLYKNFIYVDVEPWTPLRWLYTQFGAGVKESNTFTHGNPAVHLYIRNIPTWITVMDEDTAAQLISDDEVINGHELSFYPSSQNTGATRSGTILIEDDTVNKNNYEVPITQYAYVSPLAVTVTNDPNEENIYIDEYEGSNVVGSTACVFNFSPWHRLYGEGVPYTVGYRIEKNGINVGSGTIPVLNTYNTGNLTEYMSSPSTVGDVIYIYIWKE